jgi:hypothetical protein
MQNSQTQGASLEGSLDRRRSQRNLKNLGVLFISHGDEVSFTHHVGPFRPDSVSDEAPVIPGLIVIRAHMAGQVMSFDLASQMEEIPGHVGQLQVGLLVPKSKGDRLLAC